MDAFCNGIKEHLSIDFKIVSYDEHSLDKGSSSRAVSYIHIEDEEGNSFFGAGINTNISTSSIKALISAINKMISNRQ